LKFIKLERVPASEFEWRDDSLAAFACRLEGLAVYETKRLERHTPANLSPEQTVLIFSIVEMAEETMYNGSTYLDTLNPEATEAFLRSTHEKYKAHCGDKLGRSIHGIFTDEPHRGSLFDGFGLANKDAEWLAPWTYSLFDEFREMFGYDLEARLPELFLLPEGQAVSQVKWHYVELLQTMFLEHFAKPVQEWCTRNGLLLTGHILHEDSLAAQTAVSGSMMRYYEHMDIPGIDHLTEGNRKYWIAKQLASAARQLGRKWQFSELYGATGWQMPFEGHKYVGDWQALFGINVRAHHLSWYTMAGESKRDYPASISYQSAWWRDYRYVETYFSRIGYIISQGTQACEVLVINPVESVWCQVYPGWSTYLQANAPAVQELERQHAALFEWMAGSQIDFDYGDEEMMGRLSSIETSDQEGPNLRIQQASYKVVIVSGMTTIRATTLRILEQFMLAGGKVIFAGEAPAYVDALPSSAAATIASRGIRVPFAKESIVHACKMHINVFAEAVRAMDLHAEPVQELFCQVRIDGDVRYALFMNMDRERWQRDVVIRLKGAGYVQEWNCADGGRSRLQTRQKDGYSEFTADFPPGGERLFTLTPDYEPAVADQPANRFELAQTLQGPYEYKLSEPNVLVLDRARYRLNGGDWQPAKEILKADREIRSTLGMDLRGGMMLQPWYVTQSQDCTCETQEFPLELMFEFQIDDIPTGLVTLAMEQPNLFTAYLNDRLLPVPDDTDWWVDPCFRKIPVPNEWLREGANTIRLETVFRQGVDLEALYLLGGFGVRLSGADTIVTRLPARITAGDLAAQGFPFYSGTMTYFLTVNPERLRNRKVRLARLDYDAACLKVAITGQETQMIAWQPYEAELECGAVSDGKIQLDVVLTRRNTFGPLHMVPVYSWAYAPEHWVTEGDSFSEAYQLVPSGLRHAPELYIMEERGNNR
ncbi:MAG: hypothetical protein J7639_31595, partial [Paenibacillaceae bacterium]|nr:hypothetical protein [Paenibacillaceae bacterium]